jgi:hypothetical protein
MCTWQSITNVLDRYFPSFFVLAFVAFFATAIISYNAMTEIQRRKKAAGLKQSWWQRFFSEARGPTDAELRATGYEWFVRVRYATFIVFAVAVIYPSMSPTFCVNLQCIGDVDGLQPLATCK